MDLSYSKQDKAFRKQVRAWMKKNVPKKDKALSTLAPDDPRRIARAKAWQRSLHQAGYVARGWPKEYGGQGDSDVMRQTIVNEELLLARAPGLIGASGLTMLGPTLLQCGTEQQKQRYLPTVLTAEEIWCQGYSEPGSGSDLASLRTRAELVGDEFIINGQKVWTSGAHYSDWGILVARHDSSLPKHKGLTFFFIDMKSPGIEIKPIKQINGGSNFNEVFFTNVRVPDSQRLGAIGEGWQVAITTLMNERLAVGGAPPPDFREVMKLAAACELDGRPALEDSSVREKIADWYVESMGMAHTKARTLTALSQGKVPGPENSIGKVVSASKLQNVSSFGTDLMDMGGVITDPSLMPSDALFQQSFLYSPGLRIAGGTDEILRNIIAERVLGLPGEIRVDRDVPYNDIPTGN
jgi:alkylation response protein AidB-like acyl-CoA dehydrogenase